MVLRVQERERAARHARSVPLIAVTVALAVLTGLHQGYGPRVWPVEVVAPTVTFVILWLVMAVQRQVSGAGWGRDGYDGRRQRTWARITPAGRQSLLAEVELLRSIAALAAVTGEDGRPDADT